MVVVLAADGSTAYLTEPSSNAVAVFNTWSGDRRATIPVGDTPSRLALSPNGTQLWVVNTSIGAEPATTSPFEQASVSIIATATDAVVGTVDVGPGPIDVAFSPDGRLAYVSDNGGLSPGSVDVVDTATLAVVATIAPPLPSSTAPTGWHPTSVAVTPDGRQLWVSSVDLFDGNHGDLVTVFDTTTRTPVASIPVGSGPYFMVLSRDGRLAYVADKTSCAIRQIDTATDRILSTVRWPASAGCAFGLVAGPTDDLVYAVTGEDHTFSEGHAGNALGAVDFASDHVTIVAHVGIDPVTVALSPAGTTAFVVDADSPGVDIVDLTTGLITGRLNLG